LVLFAIRLLALVHSQRLNFKTDCKTFFRVLGPSVQDKNEALRRLMFWCVRAQEFPRQREHMWFEPEASELPPIDFLKARRLDGNAPLRPEVRTDDELDSAYVCPSRLPPQSWVGVPVLLDPREPAPGRGRGRGGRGRAARGTTFGQLGEGRGRGRSRGRGRGRGRGVSGDSNDSDLSKPPEPEAPSPAPDPKSSTSSDSSEGSSSSDSSDSSSGPSK
jgi:hypothetical protein